MTDNIVQKMHDTAKLSRAKIGGEVAVVPRVRVEFAKLARPGYVGVNWKRGGWVLVGASPYSTDTDDEDKAMRINEKHRALDQTHIKRLKNFRDRPSTENFRALMEHERQDIKGCWALGWAISGTLERIEVGLDDVAILNAIPFSTKGAPRKSCPSWSNAACKHLEPILTALEFGNLVWLGKAAQRSAPRHMSLELAERSVCVSRWRSWSLERRFSDLRTHLSK